MTGTPMTASRPVIPLALAAILSLLPGAVAAADGGADETPVPTVIRGRAVGDYIVPHVFYGDLRDLPRAAGWAPGDPYTVNPRRWRGTLRETATPERLDPLLAVQKRSLQRGAGAITVVHDFEGLDTGAQPPDTTGDVGNQYFIHAVNATTFAVYDKGSGAMVAGPIVMDSLGTGACASGQGDPIVLFDELADRWLISEFDTGMSFPSILCVYVSMTDDPVTGGWCEYQIDTPGFPDYPKYGVWPDAYYVTTNQGARVYALDRVNMIDCGTARPFVQLQAPDLPGLGFQAFTPSDLDGGTPPPVGAPAYMMRHRDTELNSQGPALPADDILEIWAASIDFDTPTDSTLTQLPDILTAEFDSDLCSPISIFECIPQPGSSVLLDPLLEVIMFRLGYRNFGTHESLVGVFQTDVGDFADHAGERWFELRKVGAGDWTLHQEGTYSPDGEHRFMGAIAMDAEGNILLGYAVSSAAVSPSVRLTGRLAGDPLGTMTLAEQTLVAGSGNNLVNRYGDYSQMGVDPVDGCTFWFTVEYTEGADNAANRIGAVRFNGCGVTPIFTDGFESGDSSTWSQTVPPP